jgi:hypothetical protein
MVNCNDLLTARNGSSFSLPIAHHSDLLQGTTINFERDSAACQPFRPIDAEAPRDRAVSARFVLGWLGLLHVKIKCCHRIPPSR